MSWEVVMGLEVHLQLATDSKIFSGAANRFGADPNEQACAVDLGMPGMLPVLNERAVRFAVMFGLGVGARIGKRSVFDRKNYFYPDLPKGYQVSQFFEPIVCEGQFDVPMPDGSLFPIRITRAHLEEDAGKSVHDAYAGQTGIDLNRAGTPLLEIVTEPDFRTAEQAVAYLKSLHSLATYLGISDGNMAEGSMRCDINISLRPQGSDEFGTRTEIKNVNSFRFVERAIAVETERQIDILESGGQVVQETRLYDADRNETRSMRSKEVANDYRYFPEPDLLPIVLDDHYIDTLKAELPELPGAKRARFIDSYELSDYDASLLVASRDSADFFEAATGISKSPKLTANWMLGDLAAALNRESLTISESPVSAAALAGLIVRIADDTLSSKLAKQVFEGLWLGEGSADEIIEARGLKQVTDTGALEQMVASVITDNPDQVAQYRAADEGKQKKLLGFFVGQVMKASKAGQPPASQRPAQGYARRLSHSRRSTVIGNPALHEALPVFAFFLGALAQQDIHCPGTAMGGLGRVVRLHIIDILQPPIDVALEYCRSLLLGLAVALAVQNQHGAQPIGHGIDNKAMHFVAGLFDGHSVQVKPGVYLVTPLTQFLYTPCWIPGRLKSSTYQASSGSTPSSTRALTGPCRVPAAARRRAASSPLFSFRCNLSRGSRFRGTTPAISA